MALDFGYRFRVKSMGQLHQGKNKMGQLTKEQETAIDTDNEAIRKRGLPRFEDAKKAFKRNGHTDADFLAYEYALKVANEDLDRQARIAFGHKGNPVRIYRDKRVTAWRARKGNAPASL